MHHLLGEAVSEKDVIKSTTPDYGGAEKNTSFTSISVSEAAIRAIHDKYPAPTVEATRAR